MTSATTKRHRLALMAAGTAAAMVLLPATASAQPENPLDPVTNAVTEVAGSVSGQSPGQTPVAPGALPDVAGQGLIPNNPIPLLDEGDKTEDRDSPGHETDDPVFPDHAAGDVANVDVGEEDNNPSEIADVTEYDATIGDDASTDGDATVLALFGDEIFGSHADSQTGPPEESENITEALCEGTNGGLCLSLLYSDAYASETDALSLAGGRAGVAALCLGGSNGEITTSDECDGPILLGAAEGIGVAERNADGNTTDASKNEAVNLCLGGTNVGTFCDGFGVSALNGVSASQANDEAATTESGSYVLGFDSGGNEVFRADDPASLAIPPDCGGLNDEGAALLCLFVNQGEEFVFGAGQAAGVDFERGAASAVEALHLDVLRNTPLAILAELGKAESIARDFDCDKENPDGPCPGGEKPPGGDKPECSDGIDNDGDGDIDFPADKDCESPKDDSEAGDDGGKDDGDKGDGDKDDDLAFTGVDIAPMLAAALALLGLGALTVAATRRRAGKHTV
ncbi:MAG: hypothetical protein M3R63_23635 [Actinomycetota bacterium]|nr:hypothetical protein [Actinomycetota bacterium]